MDFLSKQKLTNLLIVILVVMNIASLSFIWYKQLQPPPAPSAPPPPRVHVNRFLEDELNLTPAQQKEFAEIRKEHAQKTRVMKDGMEKLRRQILQESFSDKPDTAKIKMLAEKIGETQKNYEIFLSEHFRNLNAVCNVEQKEKLKEIFIKSLAPPPPPPNEPEPGMQPPPPGKPQG